MNKPVKYKYLGVLDMIEKSFHLYKISKEITDIHDYIFKHTEHKLGFYYALVSEEEIKVQAAFPLD